MLSFKNKCQSSAKQGPYWGAEKNFSCFPGTMSSVWWLKLKMAKNGIKAKNVSTERWMGAQCRGQIYVDITIPMKRQAHTLSDVHARHQMWQQDVDAMRLFFIWLVMQIEMLALGGGAMQSREALESHISPSLTNWSPTAAVTNFHCLNRNFPVIERLTHSLSCTYVWNLGQQSGPSSALLLYPSWFSFRLGINTVPHLTNSDTTLQCKPDTV